MQGKGKFGCSTFKYALRNIAGEASDIHEEVSMIHVYLLGVGELRCQMEKLVYIKEKPKSSSSIGLSISRSTSSYAADLPGWDKLAGWQQEKISRCATSGARALCMGGQLLLQYGACEWSACDFPLKSESWRGKNVPSDKDVKEVTSFGMSESESVTTENGISWRIMDFSRLLESIPAPQPLAAVYEPKGKPYILHVPWCHNLSHSGDYVALAMSDAPVGIDIQQMRPYRASLVKRFFSAEEIAVHESLVSMNIQRGKTPADARQNSTDVQRQNAAKQQLFGDGETLFYTLWSRKEAYGKLLGTGLTEDVLKCNMLEDVGVQLYEYGELPGYRICVCSRDNKSEMGDGSLFAVHS